STSLTHRTLWFTAGARQIAGKPAPTAFGQNQQSKSPQDRSTACGQNQKPNSPPYRFCPEGVGVRLADDGLGTSPKTGASTGLTHGTLWFTAGARQIAGKPAPTACGQNQRPNSPQDRSTACGQNQGPNSPQDRSTACGQNQQPNSPPYRPTAFGQNQKQSVLRFPTQA
ncbi:hypothetical protein ABQX22_24265, partial [Xanthomonas sp. WHRI 1810A]|uniref:hypothetical protein n=1 Tax=Xanthomonas sp. WHRI 1810A TaxID=3161565 RepID=UPI0032E899F9